MATHGGACASVINGNNSRIIRWNHPNKGIDSQTCHDVRCGLNLLILALIVCGIIYVVVKLYNKRINKPLTNDEINKRVQSKIKNELDEAEFYKNEIKRIHKTLEENGVCKNRWPSKYMQITYDEFFKYFLG